VFRCPCWSFVPCQEVAYPGMKFNSQVLE
jgi:hypothetical protein